MATEFHRKILDELKAGLLGIPGLMHVLIGPRQVGKTTLAHSLATAWEGKSHYGVADTPLPPGPAWIAAQWDAARRLDDGVRPPLLILDEVQKVFRWSEVVKSLWDEDRKTGASLRVVILGSSSLLLAEGMTESLAGRFFLHRCRHWSLGECAEAFSWDLDRWLYFGGYPGAARLAGDEQAWRSYVTDALIEAVLSRDVVAMQRVTKPALLRHLFVLAARFPAQVFSYNKMLGQLQDAGNTTTLAHYLRLLETAFLASGLERFSLGQARSRGSSPKLILWNNALVSALGLRSFEQARSDPSWWGRLAENAVGAHLVSGLQGLRYDVGYWRQGNSEVDFVVRAGDSIWAIEVKSGRLDRPLAGLDAFLARFPSARPLIVGTGGIPLASFFSTDPRDLFTVRS
ncbi:MAG: ATP-binding protein [Deltaproteobacteria bacterium]|nr:ATP-binding protein [Deltaproteobacteria bacterium]